LTIPKWYAKVNRIVIEEGGQLSTRAENRRAEYEEKLQKLWDRGVKHFRVHLGEKPSPLPIMPRTQREMQLHLSGKHTDKYRGPQNRKERREWDRFWKLKGRGFTKPEKRGERF
jgi:hypothetical protein